MVETWLFLYVKMPPKSISKHVIFKSFLGVSPRPPITLACFIQHSYSTKDFLHQNLAGYVDDLTEKGFAPHYKTSSYVYESLYSVNSSLVATIPWESPKSLEDTLTT